MTAEIATLVAAAVVIGLLLLYRDHGSRTSPALWLPVVWLVLGGTRTVTQWLGADLTTASPELYLEGSPVDRAIFSCLIVASLVVLIARWQRTRDVLVRNAPLLLFVLLCAASIAWSDFPYSSLKRWVKLLGNITMMLIVLTDYDPVLAIKQFVTRAAIIVIPASVLVILYYPEIGRYYRFYQLQESQDTVFYSGVAATKNMLGCLCMIFGLGMLSQIVDALRQRANRAACLLVLGVLSGTNLWLLALVDSVTASVCLIFGVAAIVLLRLCPQDRARVAQLLVGGASVAAVVAFAFVYAFRDTSAFPLRLLERTRTLSDRYDLWHVLLRIDTHPWIGTGFESFFLGERLEYMWGEFWWRPNQAHNGYFETYLTLGVVGLGLLALVTIAAYRGAMKLHLADRGSGSLLLAYLAIAPVYNLTESAFKAMHPLWIVFLLAVTAAPYLSRQDAGQQAPRWVGDPAGPSSPTPARQGSPRGAAQVLTWLKGRRMWRNSSLAK